ncbi:MAG: hypothetical protein ACE141_13825 [Bryobacteraceae bacterium]
MSRLSRLAPALVLLAAVLLFFRHVSFSPDYVIPWDLTGYHLPHFYFLAESLAEGRLPLWDSYTNCGRPFQADPQSAVWYPSSPLIAGLANLTSLDWLRKLLEWNVILHIWFAALGAYWLGRKLGLARLASLLLGIAYSLGGFFAAHPEHMGAVIAAAWLPWCWALVVQRSILRLSAALALSFFAGYIPVGVLVYASTVLFAMVWCGGWPDRLRPIAAGVLSLPLIAVQLLPTMELVSHSIGRYRAGFLKTGGLPWGGFITLVWPNYYNVFDPPNFRGPIDLTFLYLYSGLLTVVLAVVALLSAGRSRSVRIMTVMLATGMFILLGNTTALGRFLYRLLPEGLTNALHPEFAAPVFLLSLAALAALAFQWLHPRPRLQWLLLAVLLADITLTGSGRPFNAAPRSSEPGVDRNQLGGQTLNLEVVRRLANRTFPPWRVDTIDDSILWVAGAPAARLYTAGGSDILALVRVILSRAPFSAAERWGAYYPVKDPASPALDLQNVRYLITRVPLPPQSPLRLAAEVPGSLVYENADALPRFHLVSRVRKASSMDEAARLLASPDLSPAAEAIVEGAAALQLSNSPPGRVRVARYEHGRVDLETDAPGLQFLVSSEAFYPGWKAWVDGVETVLYPTNLGFRGLVVPAGRHQVRMEFRPRLFTISAGVSLVSWLGLLWLAWRGRRPTAASPQHAGSR